MAKIIPFPGREPNKFDQPGRNAGVFEVLAYLYGSKLAAILFVDLQPLSLEYAEQWWIRAEGVVIEIDDDIQKHFEISRVPQWRWFVHGREVHHLIGAAPREEVAEHAELARSRSPGGAK